MTDSSDAPHNVNKNHLVEENIQHKDNADTNEWSLYDSYLEFIKDLQEDLEEEFGKDTPPLPTTVYFEQNFLCGAGCDSEREDVEFEFLTTPVLTKEEFNLIYCNTFKRTPADPMSSGYFFVK